MSTPDNDVLAKIKQLYTQKGWTVYRLAKESGIPYSSLNSIILRNNQPSVPTLRKLCHGLGMTMSEFFDDDIPVSDYKCRMNLSEDEFILIEGYRNLNDLNKQLLNSYMLGLAKKELN